MIKILLKYSFLVAAMLVSSGLLAQKKVKLKNAEKLVGGIDSSGKNFNSFIDNVIFTQNETTIYCDSAVLYKKENIVRAYGNVKITEGDSITIKARQLVYDGNKKTATLRQNVIFEKLKRVTLYTDFLDYYRIQHEARYFNGGKLVDSANVLTSKKGYYDLNTNMASFKSDVVAKSPDYTLKSDTLQYNTKSNIVFFRDQTELTDVDGNVFVYEEGQYDTNVRTSNLAKGEVETQSYTLTGNRLRLDGFRNYYQAIGNVVMISKEQDVIITGDNSYFDRQKGIAKVYGRALMKRVMEGDTLYLSADTLMAIENKDPKAERVLAYNNVKIFKKDFQGLADSLAYVTADSMLFFYQNPVLWANQNQMSADSINVTIRNGTIDQLNMVQNSFVISVDSIDNFNQMKGRTMEARFRNGGLHRVNVEGNGESLFFALNDEETELIGMNKIICSSMVIRFKDNKANDLSFYVNPDAEFIPPHELEEPMRRLQGFNWRMEERPLLTEMLARNVSSGPSETDLLPPVTNSQNEKNLPVKKVLNKPQRVNDKKRNQ